MTASVLKQDPNTLKVQKAAIDEDKTENSIFRGNSLYPDAKRHLSVKNGKRVM